MTGDGINWRRERLASARLYLCCGRRPELPGVRERNPRDLEAFLDTVLAGVDLVQLRDKSADTTGVRAAADVFRRAAERHGALFVLNDDPVLAVACGADGVHVGQDDTAPDQARRIVGPDRLIGRSTHSTAEFDRGLDEDCDYLAVGPVHATPTKQGRPGVGLDPVRHAAARAAQRPWFVTGAMAPDTAPAVVEAGATRLVVVRALTDAVDPASVARGLAGLLRHAAEVS